MSGRDDDARSAASRRGTTWLIRLLRCCGMSPAEGDSKLYGAYTTVVVFNVCLTVGLLALSCVAGWRDALLVVENANNVLVMLPSVANVVSMVTRRREYHEVIADIQEVVSYEESHPEDVVKTAVRRFLSQEKNLAACFLGVSVVTVSAGVLKPVTYVFLSGDFDGRPDLQALPLKILPPQMSSSWWAFSWAYAFQVAIVILLVPSVILTDLINFLLIKHASHQLELVNIVLRKLAHDRSVELFGREVHLGNLQTTHAQKNIPVENMPSCSHVEREQNYEQALNMIACQHDRILRNVNNLSNLLSPVLLSYYLVSSLSLCLTIFSAISDSRLIIASGTLMSTILFRLLALSYFSSELNYQSTAVADSAYSSAGQEAGARCRGPLLMIMCRAQRPAVMRAGFLATMSLETFLAVLQGAYSYYSVLSKMDTS